MRSRLDRRWLPVLLAAAALAAPAPAAAEGRILFVRGPALWEKPVAGGEARVVATLPEGAAARGVAATHDGRLIVLDLTDRVGWVRAGGGALELAACAGPPRPSPRGDELACPAAGGAYTLVRTTSSGPATRALPAGLREVNYLGDWPELAALTDDGVVAVDPARPDVRRVLARPGARSHLLVAPDASRAVAVFGDGAASRIFAFALDGTGVPRQLGGPGVPRVWSWDSRWIIVQEGRRVEDDLGDDEEGEGGAELRDGGGAGDPWLLAAPGGGKGRTRGKPAGRRGRRSKPRAEPPRPPETRACVVRAVGGQTKCWNDYEGLGFSPAADQVLLRKGETLYQARLNGVRAETPRVLLEGVSGPATWIP